MSIVISGATGGVGKALAEIFAENSYDLILLGRSEKKLNDLKNNIIKNYPTIEVSYYICNINDKDTVLKSINEINELDTDIDLLINVAGIFPVMPINESSDDDYDYCMDVNLRLPLILSKGLYKKLSIGEGKIINIGSSSSYNGFKNTALYCASKHAILGLSRALNDEWKDSGVTVHCISPGTIDTEMAEILDQDKNTYIQPNEFAKLVYDVSNYSGNMLIEEVKAVRRIIR